MSHMDHSFRLFDDDSRTEGRNLEGASEDQSYRWDKRKGQQDREMGPFGRDEIAQVEGKVRMRDTEFAHAVWVYFSFDYGNGDTA